MKRKIILIAVFFLLPLALSAQSYNSAVLGSSFMSSAASPLLVRNCEDSRVVSLYYEGGHYYFACSDFSGFLGTYSSSCVSANAMYGPVNNTNLLIRDFRILKNYVFFCGIEQDTIDTIGIIGFFDLDQLSSGIPTTMFYHRMTDFSSLIKLAVYTNNSTYKIAAIGYEHSPGNNQMILEASDVMSTTPTCYKHMLITSSSPYEFIDDILYTGQSVVFVGSMEYLGARTFHLRVMNDPDDFQSSTYYNTAFVYPTSSQEVYNYTRSTLMENGRIAVTYVYRDYITSLLYTRIRIMDTFLPVPVNIISQNFETDEKYEPLELAYSSTSQKLTLLQTIRSIYFNQPQFVFLSPFVSLPYSTNYSFFPYLNRFVSLDTYHMDDIVSIGGTNAYLQSVISQNNTGCPYSNLLNVTAIPNAPSPMRYLYLRGGTTPSMTDLSYIIPTGGTWSGNCCSY